MCVCRVVYVYSRFTNTKGMNKKYWYFFSLLFPINKSLYIFFFCNFFLLVQAIALNTNTQTHTILSIFMEKMFEPINHRERHEFRSFVNQRIANGMKERPVAWDRHRMYSTQHVMYLLYTQMAYKIYLFLSLFVCSYVRCCWQQTLVRCFYIFCFIENMHSTKYHIIEQNIDL